MRTHFDTSSLSCVTHPWLETRTNTNTWTISCTYASYLQRGFQVVAQLLGYFCVCLRAFDLALAVCPFGRCGISRFPQTHIFTQMCAHFSQYMRTICWPAVDDMFVVYAFGGSSTAVSASGCAQFRRDCLRFDCMLLVQDDWALDFMLNVC